MKAQSPVGAMTQYRCKGAKTEVVSAALPTPGTSVSRLT